MYNIATVRLRSGLPIATLLCTAQCLTAADSDLPITLREHIVRTATISNASTVVPDSVEWSANGMRIAYVRQLGAGVAAVVDDNQGPRFDSVYALSFSPDASRFAYLAEAEDRYRVVLDGKQGPICDRGMGSPTFSPDSKKFAYVVYRRAPGDPIPIGEGSEPGTVTVRERIESVVNVDGKEYPPVSQVVAIVFSPDSRRMAFMAQQGTGKWAVYVDGKAGPLFDGLAAEPVFSPDSRRLAYIGMRNDKYLVVADDSEGSLYEGIGELIFSPDSKHLVYKAGKDGRTVLVVDGKEGVPQDAINDYVFSPDSRRMAYRLIRGGAHYIVIDNRESPPWDSTFQRGILFSPDASRCAYIAEKDGRQFVVLDGARGASYDAIGEWTFSPDSKSIAYAAQKDDKRLLVVNGKEGSAYQHVRCPTFAPNSRHLAYAAHGGDKFVIVVDGIQTQARFDAVYTLDFSHPSRLRATASRQADSLEVLQVEITIERAK